MENSNAPLLEVRGLSVAFSRYCRGLARHELRVITDLSLTARRGEVLAIAGSSGSGKSLLAHAVMGLLAGNAQVSGQLFYAGQPLTAERQRQLRGSKMALVPQSVTYLDPLMQVGAQARGTGPAAQKAARAAAQHEVFARLGLAPGSEKLYPFQLSGGMARRVLFSTAIIAEAELVIADEPTPGMHPAQAAEALDILRQLANAGRAVVLITHDIELALGMADRLAVFYAGTTVEETPMAQFAAGAARHPYSRALWQALPQNGFTPIPGTQPYAGALPPGCLFAPRCAHKTTACEAENPPMRPLLGGAVRCIHAT